MYDYLIAGAGLFGAVFAREAIDCGKTCLVIDRRPHIGGNMWCENICGINVHKYGPHIFHTSNGRVWEYVNRFAHFNGYINMPVAVYKGEKYNLPFNMNTFRQLWGVETEEEARAIIGSQRPEIAGPKNLEEQALSLVGRDIYEKLIKGYTEKQWGRPCSELPAFIIKRLPVRFTFDNNYFNDRWQGIPIGGYNLMIEKMLRGADVRPCTDFFDLARPAGKNTQSHTGTGLHANTKPRTGAESGTVRLPDIAGTIVYTGQIDEFFGYRFGALEYRSLRFETETLGTDDYQGNAVVNYTEREIPYTRIIEHKHFEPGASTVSGKQPKTVITKEYPMRWQPGGEPYYPVNDDKNTALYKQYRELADGMNKAGGQPRVIFGGRLGSYKYYDMDQVIAAALDASACELKLCLT